MGPRAPQSWLPCLPEGAGVQPGPLDRDPVIPPLFLPWNREQRAVSEQQPPLRPWEMSDEAGAGSVSPPAPPSTVASWGVGVQGAESPREMAGLGRVGCPVRAWMEKGKPWEAGPPFPGLPWLCTWPHAGSRLCAPNFRLGTGRGIPVSGRGRCPWSAGDHDLGST